MWLWQAEGPQTGTGSDETFAPGHCLPHSPLSKYTAEKPSLPHHHQSVSDSSWDVSFDGLYLGMCVVWAHLVSKLTYLLKNTNQMQDKTRALPSRVILLFSLLFSQQSLLSGGVQVIICHAWLILTKLFSKCQAVIPLTSKRRWQLSRSVSLWWTSTMAGHWLGRSSTCPPVTNHWARGGKEAECSFIEAR